MDELDPTAFVDQHLQSLDNGAFMLSREDMRDDWCWVDMLADFGIIEIDQQRFAWQRDLGLDAENAAKMERVRSVLVRVGGGGAYLSINRVKPEVWERICTVIGDPHAHAMPVVLVHSPALAEAIVDALLEDDFDVKDEISSLFEIDLMPLREELKKKFRLTSVVIHTLKGTYMSNYAEIHFCVAREGTSAWSGAEANDIRTFIWTELSKYTEVKRRKEIEIEIRVESKKLKGQWPYMRMVFHVVFAKDVPTFLGVDNA